MVTVSMSEQEQLFDSQSFLKQATPLPGVYQMLGKDSKILYVGKAKNLKKRLTTYFKKNISPKTASLVKQIVHIELIITETEVEALVLENNLIKQHKPKYNILFRDDKSYPYIYAATKQSYPRLDFYRGAKRLPGKYFGPYPSVHSVRETLNLLQKVFLLRSCNNSFFSNRSRPCLQYQIKRCSGPCVGLISEQAYQADFANAIAFLEGKSEQVQQSLQQRMEQAAAEQQYEIAARYRDQLASLRSVQMKQHVESGQRNVDLVAIAISADLVCVYLLLVRDGRVLGNKSFYLKLKLTESPEELLVTFLTQYYLNEAGFIPPQVVVDRELVARQTLMTAFTEKQQRKVQLQLQSAVRGDTAKWLAIAKRGAEQNLITRLSAKQSFDKKFNALAKSLQLSELNRIECFDISHHRGEATVASCVICERSGLLNQQYRRFSIQAAKASDDYAAMKEALLRRYQRIKKEEGILPDLILVDGGKGQLSQALAVMEELQLTQLPVLAIAKGPTRKAGFESLFFNTKEKQIFLQPDSPALHLLQLIRDEAHRFAITHNRQKLKKSRQSSSLESVAGVGAKRRQALLKHFGGLQQLYQASVTEIANVPGVSKSLAEKIYDALH